MIGNQYLHYRIEAQLGVGGAGEVYRAYDTRLRRPVALKFFSSDGDPQIRRQFRKEAWALAALNHPNVVKIFAIEENDGDYFLVMELVEGRSLEAIFPEDGGGVAPENLPGLVLSLLNGMNDAHQRGIFHRDLKPGNIMLNREGELKIVDFGLAHRPASTEQLIETLPVEEKVVGTVPYMPPEVLRGDSGDARSDVYALGVLIYELITGRRPFEGSTLAATAAAILTEKPEPMGDLPELAQGLEEIVARCLEKDPEHRYQDAGELLRQVQKLAGWPSDTTSHLDLTAIVEEEAPTAKPRRQLILVPIFLLMLLPIFFFLPNLQQDDAERIDSAQELRSPRLLVLPFENLGPKDENYFAAGVAEEVLRRLTEIEGLTILARSSGVRAMREDWTIEQIGKWLEADYVLAGVVRWDRSVEPHRVRVEPELIRVSDQVGIWSARHEQTLDDLFAVQANIAQDVAQQLGVRLLRPTSSEERPARNSEAYVLYLEGRAALRNAGLTIDERRETVEILRRAVELDPEQGEAWALLASAQIMQYHLGYDRSDDRRASAEEALEKARSLTPDHPLVRLVAAQYHYRIRRDYQTALREIESAERVWPGDTELRELRAWVERRRGAVAKSRATLEELLVLDPRNALIYAELGNTCSLLREDACARRAYQQAIALDAGVLDPYLLLAGHLWRQGEPSQARPYLEGAPVTDPRLLGYYWFRQEIYEGDFTAARRRAAAMEPGLIRWFNVLTTPELLEAQASELLGDDEAARDAYSKAAADLESQKENFVESGLFWSALGRARAGLGLRQEALDAARRGVELVPVEQDAVWGPDRLVDLARIETRFGEFENAAARYARLQEIPALITPEFLRIDPFFEPLREYLTENESKP